MQLVLRDGQDPGGRGELGPGELEILVLRHRSGQGLVEIVHADLLGGDERLTGGDDAERAEDHRGGCGHEHPGAALPGPDPEAAGVDDPQG